MYFILYYLNRDRKPQAETYIQNLKFDYATHIIDQFQLENVGKRYEIYIYQ